MKTYTIKEESEWTIEVDTDVITILKNGVNIKEVGLYSSSLRMTDFQNIPKSVVDKVTKVWRKVRVLGPTEVRSKRGLPSGTRSSLIFMGELRFFFTRRPGLPKTLLSWCLKVVTFPLGWRRTPRRRFVLRLILLCS